MKRIIYAFFILHSAFCILHSLPSFPGAEGWGSETPGGRGGRVVIVTNLNDAGPGSLRAAMTSSGPRIVVFRVSGVIRLSSSTVLNRYIDLVGSTHSFLTLAGQTSPGGITLTGDKKAITGTYNTDLHDIVFRFVRFRVQTAFSGTSYTCGVDGVGFCRVTDLIFDHCDFSGGSDGTMDITYAQRVTVQWCTVTNSTADCYDHGGSLIAYVPTAYISLHHNLYAHHESRAGAQMHWVGGIPTDRGQIEFVNNVCYNAAVRQFHAQVDSGELDINIIGNSFKDGPACQDKRVAPKCNAPTANLYDADNRWDKKEAADFIDWDLQGAETSPHVMSSNPITIQSSAANFEQVLTRAGYLPHDSMNIRTAQEVRDGTGELRNDQDPFSQEDPACPDDTDMDGMPDCWETAMGLNPNDATDNIKDLDGDGYTNIEEYINDLALAKLGQAPQNVALDGLCPVAVESGGLNTDHGFDLDIGPNPFSGGALSIRAGLVQGRVEIVNVQGKVVYSRPLSQAGQWSVPGNRFPAGLYVARVITDRGKQAAAKKLVVIR